MWKIQKGSVYVLYFLAQEGGVLLDDRTGSRTGYIVNHFLLLFMHKDDTARAERGIGEKQYVKQAGDESGDNDHDEDAAGSVFFLKDRPD